jgi:PAS domain S-box-containing protein
MPNTSSERRPVRILKYSATLLVVALLAFAAFLVSQSWRAAKSEQARQMTTIAALTGNAVDLYFTQLKIGMMNLGADLSVSNQKPDLDRAYTLLNRFQGQHTELRNVMLIRADGQILLTGANTSRRGLPTLAGDPAFKKILNELQPSPHFAIGQPVMGTIDKRWVIAARYAFSDRSGKLAYIISANLPMDMLQRYWVDSITPGITALGLLRDDGYLVSIYPEPDAATQDLLYGQPTEGAKTALPRANKQPMQQQIEISNEVTGTTSLMVLHRLQNYPLTLFVEMPVTEIKTAWWRDMHAPYFLMALVLACTFAFYSLKSQRRAWSAEKRRKELQRSYEHALRERSPNEIFMFDTGTLQITYANDYALEDLGYTLEQLQQMTILGLHPESGIESFGAMLEQLRRGEQESITYQTVQVRANGSSYPVEVNLQLIKAEDGGERFMAIVHDITAVKQAEENFAKFNAPVERRGGR